MSLRNLRGKRVLVTGSASGIGCATAIACARHGAKLVLCDLDAARLEPVRDVVCGVGGACITFGVDVSDEPAMQRFAERVHASGGPIDVLVNNAGIGYLGTFLDGPIEAWRRTMDINLMGVVHGPRAFLPAMHDAGGPRRVVNVASVAGVAPAPNMSIYAASKSAVIGLSESLSLELRLRESRVGLTLVGPFAKPLYHLRRLSRILRRRALLIDARKMGYC